jgi:hypothetical protein
MPGGQLVGIDCAKCRQVLLRFFCNRVWDLHPSLYVDAPLRRILHDYAFA